MSIKRASVDEDHAIFAPLSSQLASIYHLIIADHTFAQNGCQEIWEILHSQGVKPNLLTEFKSCSDQILNSDFDQHAVELILVDAYTRNLSVFDAATLLCVSCRASLELFVLHCYLSSVTASSAVEAIAGGTKLLRQAFIAQKSSSNEWSERLTEEPTTRTASVEIERHTAEHADSLEPVVHHLASSASTEQNPNVLDKVLSDAQSIVIDQFGPDNPQKTIFAELTNQLATFKKEFKTAAEVINNDIQEIEPIAKEFQKACHEADSDMLFDMVDEAVNTYNYLLKAADQLVLARDKMESLLSHYLLQYERHQQFVADVARVIAERYGEESLLTNGIEIVSEFRQLNNDISLIAAGSEYSEVKNQLGAIYKIAADLNRLDTSLQPIRDEIRLEKTIYSEFQNDRFLQLAKDREEHDPDRTFFAAMKETGWERNEGGYKYMIQKLKDFASIADQIDKQVEMFEDWTTTFQSFVKVFEDDENAAGLSKAEMDDFVARCSATIATDYRHAQSVAILINDSLIKGEQDETIMLHELGKVIYSPWISFIVWWKSCWIYKLFAG